jgi:signal transduction histidine kinase
LSNALTYGKKTDPIKITAVSNTDEFKLSVTNSCDKLSDAVLKKLFQPFSRGDVKSGSEGLGLGLYIAAEIARGHGGTLDVTSGEAETTFTLTIPVK